MSAKQRQDKVLDAWSFSDVLKKGMKEHTYTLIEEREGVIVKAGSSAITGSHQVWNKNPNFIYVRDLRIAGDMDVIVDFLEFDIFDLSEKKIDLYLEDSYSKDNSKEYSPLHKELIREIMFRKDFIKKKKEKGVEELFIVIKQGNVETRYSLDEVPYGTKKTVLRKLS